MVIFCDDGEVAVYPDTEVVEEGSATGYDGAGGPWCLVSFDGQVEDWEFVVLLGVEVHVEVVRFLFGEVLCVFLFPCGDLCLDGAHVE